MRVSSASKAKAITVVASADSPAGDIDVEFIDRASLGDTVQVWNALQGNGAASFFLSTDWILAWLKAAHVAPTLFRALQGGAVVGAALIARSPFNFRHPLRIQHRLHETGVARTDGVFIEFNGVLSKPAFAGDVFAAIVDALRVRRAQSWTRFLPHELIVSAAAPAFAADVLARVPRAEVFRRDKSPFADLAALRAAGQSFLGGISANTRQQLRRARRDFEAIGALRIERAATVESALAFLGELKPLHIARWRARGKPSGFDNPAFEPLLSELIRSGVPAGRVDVLRLWAGEKTIGYLVNFRHRDAVLNYTSGFAYAEHPKLKPGLVAHLLAIEDAYAHGAARYDFLAGAARYKDSLSTNAEELLWLRIPL
ncbi:MAG: GNAT family N-acetyltransferase [Alphaproteobacteria bacterium]|nr:GNAT family N-acetyltransferase [Alphaproteobacteria bacterium]